MKAPAGYTIDHSDQINYGGNTLTGFKLYDKNDVGDYFYVVISPEGKVVQQHKEKEEITMSPEFFHGPNGEIWVKLEPYHPDKDLEIQTPLFNRENFEPLKPSRPVPAKYIGIINNYALFYDVDLWSETKPDKLIAFEFKDGKIKKKYTTKISPRDNHTFVINNQLHLVGNDGDDRLHRVVNEKGNEIRSRRFPTKGRWIRQIVSMDFEKDSWMITNNNENQIILIKVTPEGDVSEKLLWNLDAELSHIWAPIRIAGNTYAMTFNSDKGNGWFTVRNGDLLEFWSEGEKGIYKNLINPEESISLPYDSLIIDHLTHTTEGGYAIAFSPYPKGEEMIVFNRNIS